jgi:hypothetical protein
MIILDQKADLTRRKPFVQKTMTEGLSTDSRAIMNLNAYWDIATSLVKQMWELTVCDIPICNSLLPKDE